MMYNVCACMGPLRGDPYCYCEMQKRGLEPTKMSIVEREKLNSALANVFKWKERKQNERDSLEQE